ncbi:MAG: hypothetical protein R3C53_09180 [Pirellulaceae bacterium]
MPFRRFWLRLGFWLFGSKPKPTLHRPSVLIPPTVFEFIHLTFGPATQHIIDLLRELARNGNLDIAEQQQTPYGDLFIIREQNGPLKHRKVQILVFRSFSKEIYYVASATTWWTPYVSEKNLSTLGRRFAKVERSQSIKKED